jgi:hypothetical protein
MTEKPFEPVVFTGIKPFDLTLPPQLSLPKWNPLPTEAERARNRLAAAIEAKELAKRLAEEIEVASRRWRDVHAVLVAAGNVVGVAVLKLHRPEVGYDQIECAECLTGEDYEATPAPWECATFRVVADATPGHNAGVQAP